MTCMRMIIRRTSLHFHPTLSTTALQIKAEDGRSMVSMRQSSVPGLLNDESFRIGRIISIRTNMTVAFLSVSKVESVLPHAFLVRFYKFATVLFPSFHDTRVPWLLRLRTSTAWLQLFGRFLRFLFQNNGLRWV